MILKSIRIKDVYGDEVLVSGEELIRGYREVVKAALELRFFDLFKNIHEERDKYGIKLCAKYATDDVVPDIEKIDESFIENVHQDYVDGFLL